MNDSERYVIIEATFFAEEVKDDDTGEVGWLPPIKANPWHWLYDANTGFLPADETWPEEPEEDEYGLEMMVYDFTWAGIVPMAQWQTFADRWGYEPDNSEPNMGMFCELGWIPGYRWNDGGENWNVSGWTPALEVTVSASPTEAEARANPDHFCLTHDLLSLTFEGTTDDQ